MADGEITEQQGHDHLRDKRRDFVSSEFDPLLALQTPGLRPPVPDAPVLDNVSKCAALLPPDETQQQASAATVQSEVSTVARHRGCAACLAHLERASLAAVSTCTAERRQSNPIVNLQVLFRSGFHLFIYDSLTISQEERLKRSEEQQAKKAKAAALKQRAQKVAQRAKASVRIQPLAAIMLLAAKGPLAVLAKWQASAQQVYVVTRHAAGVRGRATGVIRAFDRFMNVVLSDVEEAYTVIIKVPRVKQQQVQQHQQQHQEVEATGSATHESIEEQQPQQQIAEIMGLLPLPQQQEQQQQEQQEACCKEQQQEPVQQHLASSSQQQMQPLQQQSSHMRTRVRWCRKQEHRYRKLDQVLLKGDSIVLISNQPPVGGVLRPPDSVHR